MHASSVFVEKKGTFTGHRDCVYTLERAAEPNLFFSAAGDGLVVQWNLNSPDQGELIARIPASVYALHYLPAQSQLWIGQNFEGVHVIDFHTRQEKKSLKLTTSAIFDIKSHGQDVFVATGDGSVIVLDAHTVAIRKHIKASGKSARCLSVNPVTEELAVGYSDNYIRILDLRSLTLKQEIAAHNNSIFTIQYTPDFRFLVSGGRDAHLNFWEVGDKYTMQQSIVAHMYAINHITFSPDGNYFLTGSMDKSIKVWEASSRKLIKVIDRARHAGHGTSVNKLLWTSCQDQIASCSDDRTISIWKLTINTPQFS